MPSIISIDNNLKTKVIHQLEYYFSDINLRTDYFIKSMAQKDFGWLSIETLMKFNRLKSLVNNDKSLLTQALMAFQSDVIEWDPNGRKIRRRTDRPVPEMDADVKRYFNELSVKVKGFPFDTTMDELLEWSQQLGSVLNIQMMRLKESRQFNGCVIITFADKNMVEMVINKSALKFKGAELIKETKRIQKQRNRKPMASKAVLNNGDLIDKMKTISMDTQQRGAAVGIEGTVLQLKGIPRRVVAKEKKKKSTQIRQFFSGYGKVVYVSSDSSGKCLIQFSDRSMAQKVLDLNKEVIGEEVVHKLIFNGKEVTARMLSSDEELGFWMKANKRKQKKLKRKERKKMQNRLKAHKSQLMRKRSNSSLTLGKEPKRMTPATA